ncbi:MAG: MFS transporter [Acidobacteria bacterium]|nr:MFS transporter [Acidobacteriota bacterium]
MSERNFRLFLIGYTTSMIGTGVVPVALSFALLKEGRSAQEIGFVFAAQTVPLVLLLLLGGAAADRSRKAVMVSADLARCASEVALATLFIVTTPSLYSVMALASVLGIGQAFSSPALSGLMPQLTKTSNIHQANAIKASASSAGQLIGPALAGIVIAVASPGWALYIDGVSYAISALCIVLLRIPRMKPRTGESMLVELRHGWREFSSRSWLWIIVVQFGLFRMMVYGPFMVLGSVLANRYLGGSSSWALILSAQGAGSVVGGLVMQRLRPNHPLKVAILATFAFAGPVTCMAMESPATVIAAASAISGFAIAVFVTLWESTIQREIPTEVLSRVAAYDWLGSYALTPVGYIVGALLAARIGIRSTLIVSAIWAVLSSSIVLSIPTIRRLQINQSR